MNFSAGVSIRKDKIVKIHFFGTIEAERRTAFGDDFFKNSIVCIFAD
jgi:hypothetical protein